MKNVFVALALVITVAVLFPDQVESACCPSACNKCWDNTVATPCCGYGKCNIFCCNCDGGCRWCKNYSLMGFIRTTFFGKDECAVDHEAASREYLNELIETYDQSGDGTLNLQEARAWWSVKSKGKAGLNIEAEFRKLDTDNDGKLTKQEIDP